MSTQSSDSPELSPWNYAFGPLYALSALERNGLTARDDLITITSEEGDKLFPQGQFKVAEDGSITPREAVIDFWNKTFKPVLDEGVVHEYMAVAYYFAPRGEGKSFADMIDAKEGTPERNMATLAISRTFKSWRQ